MHFANCKKPDQNKTKRVRVATIPLKHKGTVRLMTHPESPSKCSTSGRIRSLSSVHKTILLSLTH